MVQGLAMQLHTQSVHMTRMQQQIVQIVKKWNKIGSQETNIENRKTELKDNKLM